MSTLAPSRAVIELPVRRLERGGERRGVDRLAAESALEIRVDGRPFTVLLRTPGDDSELVLGLLHSEGIVTGRAQVRSLARPEALVDDDCDNVIDVALVDGAGVRLPERTLYSSAACGACGKASRAELELRVPRIESSLRVERALLEALPERLRAHQPLFAETGGLHAAALVSATGEILVVREDVGRHNAVDKLVGWALEQGRLPLSGHLLFVSGRLGFEIVQKAIVAGLPLIGAVGAASSMAVDLATSFGVTLASFVRPTGMNLFGVTERVLAGAPSTGGA